MDHCKTSRVALEINLKQGEPTRFASSRNASLYPAWGQSSVRDMYAVLMVLRTLIGVAVVCISCFLISLCEDVLVRLAVSESVYLQRHSRLPEGGLLTDSKRGVILPELNLPFTLSSANANVFLCACS